MARPIDPFSQRQQQQSWRNKGRSGITTLPPNGYAGPFPTWPDNDEPTPQERQLWDELWRTPQAAKWVDSGYDRVLARYVRLYFRADEEAKGTWLSELRQIEDRLGLSPLGLRRLGWQIGGQSSRTPGNDREKTPAEKRYPHLRAADN